MRSLRIAFNGQRLAGQRFGVGRYIEYLLRHWASFLSTDDEVSLFLRQPVGSDISGLSPRIKPTLLASKQSGLVWENLRLREAAAKHDVLFCPAYTAPLGFRGGLVVANHSVNELQDGAHSWLYKQTYARLHRHSARTADAVIVPGATVRKAVTEHYGVPNNRIFEVHQGADDVFHPIHDQALLDSVRTRFFGRPRPYLLFVGKCSARRNIPLLIRAFADLRKERDIPHGLLLFGPEKDGLDVRALAAELGVSDDVVQTDGVIASHAELPPIYAAADIFVQPSVNEGWSMTTVEALACGVPVIAADRGGLADIARGHALMIEPDVGVLKAAIDTVLHDSAIRSELQRKARERGVALGWREAARQTLDIVRSVG